MSPEEFDTVLSDLETRVDRLRALYENWFRGYEKAEPAVARKEVERKVYALRKELPRNTALRFRYHQLYQRFTTLASYWQRTARQIEEGTYRLQLKRIRRRNDQSATDENARTIAPRPSLEGESSAPPPAYEVTLDEPVDVQALLDEAARASPGAARERPATPAASKPAARRFSRPTATLSEPPASPGVTLEGRAPEGLPDELVAQRGSLPAARGSLPSARGSAPSMPRGSAPSTTRGARPSLEQGAERMPSGYPTLPPSARIPAANTGAIPGMPAPRVPLIPPAEGGPPTGVKLPPAPRTGVAPPPARPSLAASVPPPRPPPLATKTGAFSVPPPTGGLPKPSPRASVPPPRPAAPVVAGPSAAPRPAPPRPPPPPPPPPRAAAPAIPRPAPGPPPRPPAPPPARSGAEGPIADQRMRRLYDEYAAARRKNNEGEVRYETLASSIQKMMPDLRKKHQGKDIDFEVVIKDGRVGLKPKPT